MERTRSETDGHEVLLQLTAEGRKAAGAVTKVEAQPHVEIERRSVGHVPDAAMAFLRAFVADLPTGESVARRFPR